MDLQVNCISVTEQSLYEKNVFYFIPVESPILEKVRSGGSGQTFALPTKKKVSEQMEVASAPTYASILKKGLKWAPVTVQSL